MNSCHEPLGQETSGTEAALGPIRANFLGQAELFLNQPMDGRVSYPRQSWAVGFTVAAESSGLLRSKTKLRREVQD